MNTYKVGLRKRTPSELSRLVYRQNEDKYLLDVRSNPNNFSKWYPCILKAPMDEMSVPKSLVFIVPDEVANSCFNPTEDNFEVIDFWVQDTVMPVLEKENMIGNTVFVKNGTFSNKYDFKTSKINAVAPEISASLFGINYASDILGAGGLGELVIRKFVGLEDQETPCIYNGMKLFPEFRVFYDFCEHKPLYIVNYWNWDYCHDSICNDPTDKIVYEYYYHTIEELFEKYKDKILYVCQKNLSKINMKSIFEETHGTYYYEHVGSKWSVDFMVVNDKIYLTDMALASNSAYWDPEKIK